MNRLVCLTLVVMFTPFLLHAQTERWVYPCNGQGTGNINDQGNSIIYGRDGNIYAAGHSTDNTSSTGRDFTILKFTTDGTLQWVCAYNSTGSRNDYAYEIIYGADDNIYAAGTRGTVPCFTVISVDTAGNERWLYTYNGPGEYNDGAHDIIYGLDGNLYVAGYGTDGVDDTDVKIISIDTTGNERWNYTYCGLQHGDHTNEIVYGPDNNLYAVRNRVIAKQLTATPYTVTLRDKEIANCASGVYFLSVRSEQRTVATAQLLKLK